MKRAFSLVELSIVLAIIGLLIGGVIAGKSMIRAAELRATTTQINQFLTSFKQFNSQYRGLPGDIINATSYWGIAAGTGSDATCYNKHSAGQQPTCNGNGDGSLDQNNEAFRSWQHLANAGLVEGSYDGMKTPFPGPCPLTTPATPRAKLSNSAFNIYPAPSCSTTYYSTTFHNYLLLASPWAGACGIAVTQFGVLTPTEAWSIDTKVDDGMPATGQWVAALTSSPNIFGNATAGVTSSSCTDVTGTYNTAIDTFTIDFMVSLD